MIVAKLGHVKTLEEFYSEIRRQQEEAHGNDYCEQHDALVRLLTKEGCTTYKELGTNQGATAAAAMLCNPKEIELIDIDMRRYKQFLKPLAEKYCAENNIKLTVKEISSTDIGSLGISPDVLLIDSYHTPQHMRKELILHQHTVKKYMVFHDTTVQQSLYDTIAGFCSDTKVWEIVERGTTNVGYTVIKRIKQ